MADPPCSPTPSRYTLNYPLSQGGRGNYQYQGRDYYVSWRDGRKSFTWADAQRECASRGMRMISLDDTAKSAHFLGLTGQERQDYFWAGGRISRSVSREGRAGLPSLASV